MVMGTRLHIGMKTFSWLNIHCITPNIIYYLHGCYVRTMMFNLYLYIVTATLASCTGRGRYQCENGHCVTLDVICDGIDNCGDASDENNHTLCHFTPPLSGCDFMCDNKKCVTESNICNYNDDCGDNSDEKGCRK